jgi:hypothetical protein
MKRWLIVLISMLLLGSMYGAYEWHQRHVTDEFRRILVALFDPSNTNADAASYLHDAKLAIRTPEDNRVLSQLESLLQLRSRSTDVDWLLSHSVDDLTKSIKQADELERSIRHELGLPAPSRKSVP